MIILQASNGVLASAAQFITLLLIFVLVLGLTYVTTRVAGGYKKQQMQGKNIRIMETVSISASKYLQIVQVGRRYFLIAVCKDTVTYLSELNEDDLDFSENPGTGESFKSILEKFKKNMQAEENSQDSNKDNNKE